MEVISKPAEPKTIHVKDIDIRYPGETAMHTLRPEDEYAETEDVIHIDYANGERLTFYKRNVLWVSVREREMVVPPDKTNEPPHRSPDGEKPVSAGL